jgi:hypothetical protein
MSRLSPDEYVHITFVACVNCAARAWMGPAELETLRDWQYDIQADFEQASEEAGGRLQ